MAGEVESRDALQINRADQLDSWSSSGSPWRRWAENIEERAVRQRKEDEDEDLKAEKKKSFKGYGSDLYPFHGLRVEAMWPKGRSAVGLKPWLTQF